MNFIIDTNACIDFLVLDIFELFGMDELKIEVPPNVYAELKEKKIRNLSNKKYSKYDDLSSIEKNKQKMLSILASKIIYFEDEDKLVRKNLVSNNLFKIRGDGDLDILALIKNSKYFEVVSRDADLLSYCLGVNKVNCYWPICFLKYLEENYNFIVDYNKLEILVDILNLKDWRKFEQDYKNNKHFIMMGYNILSYMAQKNPLDGVTFC